MEVTFNVNGIRNSKSVIMDTYDKEKPDMEKDNIGGHNEKHDNKQRAYINVIAEIV